MLPYEAAARKKYLKMFKVRLALSLLAVVAFAGLSSGQIKASFERNSLPPIMPVGNVKEGMRGTARTVFNGTKPEEFQVEILGVVPNWIGPRQDMIVGRLSGGKADRTFVFAGMSGSPVYIDGQLVGAISYSFPFAKEPICGITPIEQMISTTVAGTDETGPRVARSFSYSQFMTPATMTVAGLPATAKLYTPGFTPYDPSGSRQVLLNMTGYSAMPIATPIAVSGVSQAVIDMLAPAFAQVHAVLVPGTAGNTGITPMKKFNETTLLGGDSVVVHLSRGDIQIAAAGTVTLRDGEKIYAFGHPFFSLGSTNLPMSESHVVTVVPNANNSFKLAVPDSMVGSMTQDRATAIYGKLGTEPKMIPVRVRLTTSRGRVEETNFESAIDETFSALIVNAGVANILQAHERSIGEATINVKGEIRVKGQQPVKIDRRFAGLQATAFASSVAAIPVGALLHANFDDLDITGIDLDMTATDGSRTAVLDRISLDRTQARAGDTVEATVFIRNEAGAITPLRVPVTIPKDTTPGMISLQIADGGQAQPTNSAAQFTPRNAAELIATINKLKRSDRLYAVLSRTSTGAVIGTSEMPNLPPSVMATINNDRTSGGTKPSVQTVLTEIQLPSSSYIVSGTQTLQIEVIR